METRVAEQQPSAIRPEDVRQALERVLSSKYFVNAHKKKEFLRLICDFYLEGRAHELNEYVLGYDVFGRDNSYNPSADPIVRVFAHEIRKKLEIYYKNEGANDPVRLEIPAGSYQPVFTRHPPETAEASDETSEITQSKIEIVPARPRLSPTTLVLSVALLCLTVVLVVMAVSNRQLRHRVTEAESIKNPATYGEAWAPFLKDNNPPLVVIGNPPVWSTNSSDPEAQTKDSIPLAPEAVKALKDKFVINPQVVIKESGEPSNNASGPLKDKVATERNRTPSLILNMKDYTGMGEAIGLHYLTDFFGKANRSPLFKQSRTLSAEDLKKHNVILLGGAWVNEWSNKLARTEDFVFTGRATIENRNPQPGEEREYIPQFDRRTGSLVVDYALITVKPNISDVNQVMLLAGIYSQGTEAAAEFVTDKNYLDQLNQRLRQLTESGAPRHFQALLEVGVENGIPTTISILALHELRLPKP